ncbi:MAG: o-succinylbenzoate synthase [Bacteroidaceae bacterium]|nr:o-succinylbenzoate synthase [Bacteroidaceae bacterium]
MINYYVLPHTLQFKRPARTSRGEYRDKKVWYVFLSVEPLSEELCLTYLKEPSRWGGCRIGVGEIAPLYDLSCDFVDNFEAVIGDCLQRCYELQTNDAFINYDVLQEFPSILFGVETAWYSLHAPDGLALFDSDFSNAKRCIHINGLVWMSDLAEMERQALEKIKLGFKCIKFKIGALDWHKELEIIERIRTRYSKDELEIRVDANGAFSMWDVFPVLERLNQLDVHSIEQPIKAGQWDSMAELCRCSPISIALDEELIGIHYLDGKHKLMQTICPQYIVLKPTLHGGFKGVDEWVMLAEEMRVGYWLTSALESNVGLNAIAQKAALLNGAERWQGLGTGQLFVENIEGLGLSLEGEALWRF